MALASYASNPGAYFAIGDSVIPLSSRNVRHQAVRQVRESLAGTMRAAVTSETPWRRIWVFSTEILDIADIQTIEALLRAPGAVTVNGGGVGTDTSMLALSFERTEENGIEARLSGELVETNPVS